MFEYLVFNEDEAFSLHREIRLEMDGDKLRIANISSRDDVLRAVRAACLVSENTEDLPWPLSLRAERIYAVGLEGGRLE